jgi:hypothetical protein
MEILGYSKCQCGAITIYTDALNYSCKRENLKKFFPNIDLRKITRYQESYCCDHCANRYGLDLCGCGSGADFGECDNDFDECQMPMQSIGEYACVRAGDSWV